MKMKIHELSQRYTVLRLTEEHLPQLLELCLTNPLFYQHCPPPPTRETLLADMHALPPRKTMADKYYLGFFQNGRLVAVLDLILRFPNDETAFIGFFMMNASDQGRGEGSRLISELFACLKKEFAFVRLGYVKGNSQSMHFWHKNGLQETGVVVPANGYEIIYTQKTL